MLSEWARRCRDARRQNGETLADVLRAPLALRPDAVALWFEGQSVTFRQLDEVATRVANGLIARGIEPGDRVAMHLDNRPEFVEIYLGIMRAGATLVPTNVMYTAEEMAHILSDSGARVVFSRSDLSRKLSGIAGLGALEHLIEVGPRSGAPAMAFEDFLEQAQTVAPDLTIDPESVATIQYTSGTTGKPKGAMVTHRNVLAVLDGTADLPGSLEAREEDSVVLVLPLFHAYALNLALNRALMTGCKAVIVNRFDADRVLELIERHRVTIYYGAPPMYFAFVNTPGLEKYDLSSLRMAFSGAAPLPVVVLERFREMSGVEICEGYGLSETAPTLCSNMAGPVNKPGSVGPPIPGVELRFVDEQDQDVAPGEVGEILARGPNVFKGYFNRPRETATALAGGWFHTGDLGRVDEDGYVYIVDRKKDMILVSGYNVYPIEVENVILRHPKVTDCAVVGRAHDYQGEAVGAVCVLADGQELLLEELQAYCREHLAAYKIPRWLEIRDELPRNATGKLLKRELRAAPSKA